MTDTNNQAELDIETNKFKMVLTTRIKVVDNYRKTFNPKSLAELAESVGNEGVLEPLLVRRNPQNNGLELIAGERRLKAAKMAGLMHVPVRVLDNISDEKFHELQLIENLQREAVGYMEEARAVKRLRDSGDLTVDEIAKKIHKSPSTVYDMMKLNSLQGIALDAANKGLFTRPVALIIAKKLDNLEDQRRAAFDLRRNQKDKRVSARFANRYIQENITLDGEGVTDGPVRRKNEIERKEGNDFQANWKKYLITFNAQQFKYFQDICRGRIETQVWSEAVEQVMIEGI